MSEADRFRVTAAMAELIEKPLKRSGSMRNARWKRKLNKKTNRSWSFTCDISDEGTQREIESPGHLELFIEPNDESLVANCDNLTIARSGDLIVCEDTSAHACRLVGVTPEGSIYTWAENHVDSEFAGATFSPDATTLFVNLQQPGLTVAITGPWDQRAEG